mgnify:CR=1 FL=1
MSKRFKSLFSGLRVLILVDWHFAGLLLVESSESMRDCKDPVRSIV